MPCPGVSNEEKYSSLSPFQRVTPLTRLAAHTYNRDIYLAPRVPARGTPTMRRSASVPGHGRGAPCGYPGARPIPVISNLDGLLFRQVEALAETLHTTRSVKNTLLASEERMAL